LTISYVNKGAIGDGTGNVSPTNVPYPASLVTGNKLQLIVQSGSTSNLVASTPSGWTFVGNILGGDPAAYGPFAGPRNVAVFERTVDGSEGANVAVSWDSAGGGGSEFQGQIHQFSKTGSSWAATAFVTGQDTSVGNGAASYDATSSSSLAAASGDFLTVVTGMGNAALLANPALTMTGLTLGSVTEQESAMQAGGRGGIEYVTAEVTAGSATVAIRIVADNMTDAAGGASVFTRLREVSGGGGTPVSNFMLLGVG
jgi:hypothetical protein